MNIKKVLAGSLAAITAGATMALGAYAAGLGDYVVASDGSLTSPTIVIGNPAAPSADFAYDVIGAADIAAAVAGHATVEKTVESAGGTASATNGWLITSDLNKTYLSGAFSDVKSTLTKSQLPELLANDSILDTNNVETKVNLRLEPGSHSVDYGIPTGSTEPYLYMNFSNSPTYTLKILFTGGLNTSAIDTTKDVMLFGKEYTFGETVSNSTVTLYSKEGVATTTLSGVGDEETVTVSGTDYVFKLLGWNTNEDGAFLSIDDATPSTTPWLEGHTYLIPGTSIRVYMSDVSVITTGGTEKTMSAKLFVGTDKIELFDGNLAVELNDEQDTTTNVKSDFEITSGTPKIHHINITVGPATTEYITDGNTFTDPLFGFKWKLDGMNVGLTDASRDHIKLAKDGTTKVKLTFTNKDGTEYAFDAHTNKSTGWSLGDGTYSFHVQEDQNISQNDVFAVTDSGNKETYILRYSSPHTSSTSTSRYVTLTEVTSGTQFKVYLQSSDPYLRIGSGQYNVTWVEYADPYRIKIDLDGDGTIASSDYVNLYTQGEAIINPRDASYFNITEFPIYSLDNSNEPSNNTLNVSHTYSGTEYVSFALGSNIASNGGQVTSTTYRYMTDYGTYVEWDTTSDVVDLYYPGNRPAYALVAVGEDPAISVSGGSSTTYNEAIKITNSVAKLVSEIGDTSALSGDLILLGGPCANTLVATLAETDADIPTCSGWSDAGLSTGVIKEVSDAFGSGQKALVVAGTTGEDTRALAAMVMSGTTSYSV